MKVIRHGFASPSVAIIGGMHGDEHIGVKAIEKLQGLEINGSIKFIVANERALQLHQRFVETDLNQSFPGNKYGRHEEQVAYALLGEVSNADYVLDIHSTIVDTPDFIITVGKKQLVQYFPLPRVVDMSGFAKRRGTSLIENVASGISLEYCVTTSVEQVVDQLRQCLVNLGVLQDIPAMVKQENYLVYGTVEKTPQNKDIRLENFVETELNGKRFTPILHGEGAYPNILCLKAKRL